LRLEALEKRGRAEEEGRLEMLRRPSKKIKPRGARR